MKKLAFSVAALCVSIGIFVSGCALLQQATTSVSAFQTVLCDPAENVLAVLNADSAAFVPEAQTRLTQVTASINSICQGVTQVNTSTLWSIVVSSLPIVIDLAEQYGIASGSPVITALTLAGAIIDALVNGSAVTTTPAPAVSLQARLAALRAAGAPYVCSAPGTHAASKNIPICP